MPNLRPHHSQIQECLDYDAELARQAAEEEENREVIGESSYSPPSGSDDSPPDSPAPKARKLRYNV